MVPEKKKYNLLDDNGAVGGEYSNITVKKNPYLFIDSPNIYGVPPMGQAGIVLGT